MKTNHLLSKHVFYILTNNSFAINSNLLFNFYVAAMSKEHPVRFDNTSNFNLFDYILFERLIIG